MKLGNILEALHSALEKHDCISSFDSLDDSRTALLDYGTHVGILTDEQTAKLNEIGMCWLATHERYWEGKFKVAEKHFIKNEHLLPPYPNSAFKSWI